MAVEHKDIIIIGGGPAGYIAAIKAARLGAEVLLCEEDQVGGTCLNRGCIPTKYFAQSAHTILEISQASSRGISIGDASVTMDMSKALAGKKRTVKKLTGGVRSLLKDAGVTLLSKRARVNSDRLVTLDDGTLYQAKAVIIATGSTSATVPIEGIDNPLVLDSTGMLDIDYVPNHLAVIGGGVIGVEFASIFQAFGSEVTIIEAEKTILPMFDRKAVETSSAAFSKRGISLRTGVQVRQIKREGDQALLELSDQSSVAADVVLLAVGRRANLSCFEDGMPQTSRGFIRTDRFGMSSIPGIYAAGDVNGEKLLAHAAYQMGEAAAHNACVDAGIIQGGKEEFKLDVVPSVVYSVPEIASVGMTEEEASSSHETVTGFFPLSANGRALAGGETQGFVQVIADKRYGQILGVCCVGMHASEIINEAALAMNYELTVHEAAHSIHGHPSVSEAFKEAAAQCIGECYHLPG
jgi:dihydrolipoamide dehydrogenase